MKRSCKLICLKALHLVGVEENPSMNTEENNSHRARSQERNYKQPQNPVSCYLLSQEHLLAVISLALTSDSSKHDLLKSGACQPKIEMGHRTLGDCSEESTIVLSSSRFFGKLSSPKTPLNYPFIASHFLERERIHIDPLQIV